MEADIPDKDLGNTLTSHSCLTRRPVCCLGPLDNLHRAVGSHQILQTPGTVHILNLGCVGALPYPNMIH